jgi:hypothetical protein
MRAIVLALITASVLAVTAATAALADQAYHSQRIDFELTADGEVAGHPELRAGHVVNIHPNGPVNGALERYMINGALPDVSYDVVLEAFGGGCGGGSLFTMMTATLNTNAKGSAHADLTLTPSDLAPLSGATVGAQWTLQAGGVDAYQTPCTTVVID